MQRLQAVHDLEHAINQGLAAAVAQFAQSFSAAEVLVLIGVTARTFERALAGNFDRKRGRFTLENFSPGLNDLRSFQCGQSLSRALEPRELRAILSVQIISTSTNTRRLSETETQSRR